MARHGAQTVLLRPLRLARGAVCVASSCVSLVWTGVWLNEVVCGGMSYDYVR